VSDRSDAVAVNGRLASNLLPVGTFPFLSLPTVVILRVEEQYSVRHACICGNPKWHVWPTGSTIPGRQACQWPTTPATGTPDPGKCVHWKISAMQWNLHINFPTHLVHFISIHVSSRTTAGHQNDCSSFWAYNFWCGYTSSLLTPLLLSLLLGESHFNDFRWQLVSRTRILFVLLRSLPQRSKKESSSITHRRRLLQEWIQCNAYNNQSVIIEKTTINKATLSLELCNYHYCCWMADPYNIGRRGQVHHQTAPPGPTWHIIKKQRTLQQSISQSMSLSQGSAAPVPTFLATTTIAGCWTA
jgi:hypothetical protein